jgi:threonine/homoserine/homoserine lactone efflux protein
MLTYLIIGMTYAFASAVQPGPLQAYIISQTIRHGWRRTLPAAFSPLLSDGPIIVLMLVVLSRLPVWLIPTVRLAGGVLLLLFAVLAARTWWRFDASGTAPSTARPRSLLGATTVNLMSPGPYLGWSLVMGPLLLKGWSEAPVNGIALLAGFYGVLVSSMAVIIMLAGTARGLGPRANRTLMGLSALALAGLGMWQLWTWAAGLRGG